MEQLLPYFQSHFDQLQTAYRPYREHVAPLFSQLGLNLDEQKEVGVLIILSSVAVLLLSILLARLFLPGNPSKKQPSGKKSNRTGSKNPSNPKKQATPQTRHVRNDNQATRQNAQKEPITTKEKGCVPIESETAVEKATSEERKPDLIDEGPTPKQEPTAVLNEGAPQSKKTKKKEKNKDKTQKEETPKAEEPSPEKEAEQVKEVSTEKIETPAKKDLEDTTGEKGFTSEERPGSAREQDIQTSTTPLRRSQREKATPQRFSPSTKKRVRKVD